MKLYQIGHQTFADFEPCETNDTGGRVLYAGHRAARQALKSHLDDGLAAVKAGDLQDFDPADWRIAELPEADYPQYLAIVSDRDDGDMNVLATFMNGEEIFSPRVFVAFVVSVASKYGAGVKIIEMQTDCEILDMSQVAETRSVEV